MDDLRGSKDILTAELLKNVNFRSKGAQMYHLIQELVKKNIDAENFLDLLCFKSIDSAIPRLQQHLNVKDDVDSFKKIRNEIAEKLYWLKNIDTENGTRSVSEFYENDSAAVLWIQKDTSPLFHILEKIIKPETIKIFCVDIPGANANPNTIVINGKYSNDTNKIVLPTAIENSREHLGTAKTTHPKFFGTYYQNIFRPLLDKNESIETLLFKPAKCLDLMRI